MMKTKVLIPLLTLMALVILTGSILKKDKEDQNKQYHYYEDPYTCSGCHWDRFDRWNVSQHSNGFTGDFFQKQFYELVLPSMDFDSKVNNVNEGCIGCHSPTAFLSGDNIPLRTKNPDNHWNRVDGIKTRADRGVFCDFCHTLDRFQNDPPFNHDYISHATEEIDPKRADLEFPWSPHHETQTTEIFESPQFCATCHNELNPYGVWVKATEIELSQSIYLTRGTLCQDCHMQPMAGKPAKMGLIRVKNHDHWFGGGFREFVEGAAHALLVIEQDHAEPGDEIQFCIEVEAVATGHKFPTGSVEERDVWLHVSLNNEKGEEMVHIPVPENSADPNDKYFITSNEVVAYPSHSKLSDPIARDGLPEGDRLYHSAFIDSEGEFTYAQWFAVEEIENRLEPLKERIEKYEFKIPENLKPGTYYLTAVMNYRRMPDPLADYLKIERRPVIEVARDVKKILIGN